MDLSEAREMFCALTDCGDGYVSSYACWKLEDLCIPMHVHETSMLDIFVLAQGLVLSHRLSLNSSCASLPSAENK